jgi:predicted flap endonuclease-1-like 5' DNA nuclease
LGRSSEIPPRKSIPNLKEETIMTAQMNPTSTTQHALFNSPMLEFNAPPTRENLTAIARLGDVAARVRFSIRARGIEKFKQSARHRRETTRQVESTLELTMRFVGRDQAPIVMTEES